MILVDFGIRKLEVGVDSAAETLTEKPQQENDASKELFPILSQTEVDTQRDVLRSTDGRARSSSLRDDPIFVHPTRNYSEFECVSATAPQQEFNSGTNLQTSSDSQ